MPKHIIFNAPHPLNTAVLFLVFNRLDTTKQVFEKIRQAKPPRLYIAADGARESHENDSAKVEAVRNYLTNNIDWKCEVKTLFRDKNLGCKIAVSSAITWFFENEEMGIILEDDCLPSQSFFWYCEELLNKYKTDLRVWHISGDNFQNGISRGDGDYYFSKFSHVWGWASWADRWKNYDVEMNGFSIFKEGKYIENIFEQKSAQIYWTNVFTNISKGEIDTWDYQWVYTVLSNSGFSILPNKNLISNIGFGNAATHTSSLESEFSKIQNEELTNPLRAPSLMMINRLADDLTTSKMFSNSNFASRVIRKIIRTLKK